MNVALRTALFAMLAAGSAQAQAQAQVQAQAQIASPVSETAAQQQSDEIIVSARRREESLQDVPVLLPTQHVIVRGQIDQWLAQQGLRPRVVGEFEDNALLEAFGGTGLGVFPGAVAAQAELERRIQVRLLGACEGVEEQYYAISTERRVAHPLVQQLLNARAMLS